MTVIIEYLFHLIIIGLSVRKMPNSFYNPDFLNIKEKKMNGAS